MTTNQLKWLELQEQQRANRTKEEETMRSNLAKEALSQREQDIHKSLKQDENLLKNVELVQKGALGLANLFGGFSII